MFPQILQIQGIGFWFIGASDSTHNLVHKWRKSMPALRVADKKAPEPPKRPNIELFTTDLAGLGLVSTRKTQVTVLRDS